MKVLYFDCFAGAAGDMILGALVDAGVPIEALQQALGSLAVEGCEVTADRVVKHGIRATKFRVHEPAAAGPAHGHFHLSEIRAAVERSALSVAGKARANRLFTRLAEAEAAIHGSTPEQVHLHEVGALDSIIDIVGAVFALEWFAADRIVVSPMNTGNGMVKTAHGVFPVPAPAKPKHVDLLPCSFTVVGPESVLTAGLTLALGMGTAMANDVASDDPYLWLEEVEGEGGHPDEKTPHEAGRDGLRDVVP